MSEQLLVYLKENNLLPSRQSAYRAHHSTKTAVLKVLSDIMLALDSGTLQSWHCLTCQLLLTASTTQRCSNVCKRLMVLEDLSLSGLHRICITVLSMCSNLQAGRLSPQCHMKCHRVRFSDQFCSYFTLLTCCSLCKDIISIHTHMLTTHKSMDLVIRLTPAHFSSIYQIVSTMCHSRCRPTGCN